MYLNIQVDLQPKTICKYNIAFNPDGEILRLKDVANIEFGSSMYDIYSNLNGKPSAAIVLKQSFGSNANQVIEDVKAN
jgi:HAE1 family hydrophobic/amphiphilic exporter-1